MAIVFNPLTSSFDYTGSTSGNTVMPYANLAAFPSAVTAGNGALAEALDTHIIYASNGAAWVAIAGPGAVLSVGAFGSSPNANALSIIADVLYAQPASASFPGGVSTTTQTFAGDKTLSGATTLQQDLTFDTASQATIKTKNSSTATTQPMYLSSGYGTNHPSGAVAMLSGPSNQNTGDVSVYSSPPAAANNYSGVANVYTGSASGTGYSGAVNIYSGDTANAPSGNISISSGLASANSSGNITLTVGTATGTRSGNSGIITIQRYMSASSSCSSNG